jgi:hypothetical protein
LLQPEICVNAKCNNNVLYPAGGRKCINYFFSERMRVREIEAFCFDDEIQPENENKNRNTTIDE